MLILNTINNIKCITKKDGETFLNPRDISNILNNYFVCVVELTGQCDLRLCGNGVAINAFSDGYLKKPLFKFDFVTTEEVE